MDAAESDFSTRENIAIEYAERIATDHHNIDDAFFERLHEEFNDAQIIELGMLIGQFIGVGRLLMILDLEPNTCPV